jgi:DNA-binding transcriptional regulator YiaG
MKLGNFIKSLRKNTTGLKQGEYAKRYGIHQATLSYVESDTRGMSGRILLEMILDAHSANKSAFIRAIEEAKEERYTEVPERE